MLAPPDPHTDAVNLEAEAAEHMVEEHVLFHTVAASMAGGEFVVDGLRLERDGIGPGVVETQVLKVLALEGAASIFRLGLSRMLGGEERCGRDIVRVRLIKPSEGGLRHFFSDLLL